MIIPLNSTTPIAIGPFATSGTPTITIYVNGSLVTPTPGTPNAGVQIGSSGTYIASYTPAGTTDTGVAGNILLTGTIGPQSISVNIDTSTSLVFDEIFNIAADIDKINLSVGMEGIPSYGSTLSITGGGGGPLVPYGSYGGNGVWSYDNGYFWYDASNTRWTYGSAMGLTNNSSTDGATGEDWQWAATTATISPGLGSIFLNTQQIGTAALAADTNINWLVNVFIQTICQNGIPFGVLVSGDAPVPTGVYVYIGMENSGNVLFGGPWINGTYQIPTTQIKLNADTNKWDILDQYGTPTWTNEAGGILGTYTWAGHPNATVTPNFPMIQTALVDNGLAKTASGSVKASPTPTDTAFTVTDVTGTIPQFGCVVWDSTAANSGQSTFVYDDNTGEMMFPAPFPSLAEVPVAGDKFIISAESAALMTMLEVLILYFNSLTVQLDLTQVVPTSNTAHTVGDALNAARAQGFGKWVFSGTTLTLYAEDGDTVVRTFTLDSATAPTQRI